MHVSDMASELQIKTNKQTCEALSRFLQPSLVPTWVSPLISWRISFARISGTVRARHMKQLSDKQMCQLSSSPIRSLNQQRLRLRRTSPAWSHLPPDDPALATQVICPMNSHNPYDVGISQDKLPGKVS